MSRLTRLLHEPPPDTASASGRAIRLLPKQPKWKPNRKPNQLSPSFQGGVTLPHPKPNSQRAATFAAQRGICHYCTGKIEPQHWTLDHKIPRGNGGRGGLKNLVGCCWTCNHAKANVPYEKFMQSPYLEARRRYVARFNRQRELVEIKSLLKL